MRVKVSFLGILGDYVGSSELVVEMGEGSTIKDLLNEVGKAFPRELWDPERKALSPTIGVFLDQKDVDDENTALEEGSEVILVPMMAGGC